jgi:peptidoglycan/xylan/chitin deacetylase (PgdA/CDA1 family)
MTASGRLKQLIASALTSPPVTALAQPFANGHASIFMMHRFADPDRGNSGHDRETLRASLAYLRRMRYDLVGLAELVRRLEAGDRRISKSVAFTIDDGYADYASVGAPVFEEFDCPATVFIVTGVTDERGWYWWDKLRVAFEIAQHRTLTLHIDGRPLTLEWTDRATAARAARSVIDRMKLVPDAERRRILDSIPGSVHADVPASPPPRDASMSWDEIKRCGEGVTTFGAHTVSHPILARTDDATARAEIETSWRRLQQQTSAAIPVFCYPNGETSDISAREMQILRDIGITAAVTSQPGYATHGAFTGQPDGPYLVPRFSYGESRTELVQVVSGVERVKRAVRRIVPV